MIIGPSGSGKSALALQLLAYGAELVADDRTRLIRTDDALWAEAPETIGGLIEARGIGLLRLPYSGRTLLSLIVDMGQEERQRMPPPRDQEVLGVSLPCLHRVDGPHFAAALLLYLRCSISVMP